MVVLALRERGLAANLNGLLWAVVHASEAAGALVADKSLFVGERDIALRAYIGADAAADALVRIDGWGDEAVGFLLQVTFVHQPTDGVKTGIVKTMLLGGNVLDDTLQTLGILDEFPSLIVGVSTKSQCARVWYADLIAII